jgi:ABC transporter substrate binding protein
MVATGLVRSLAYPGSNTTGISIFAHELDGKRQELLMELVPGIRRMAALADARISSLPERQALEEAARAHGIDLSIHAVDTPEEIVPALDAAQTSGAEALNVLATPLFNAQRQMIIEHTAARHLPAMYQWPEIAEQGGVDLNGGELTATFDGRSVTYGFGELDALVPAYAATIHKSQGSEYPAVTTARLGLCGSSGSSVVVPTVGQAVPGTAYQ